jgi:hypothetical protein
MTGRLGLNAFYRTLFLEGDHSMKKFYRSAAFALLAGCLLTALGAARGNAQTIQQKLTVAVDDGVHFYVDVQVKGTSLPSANTLGSATIDIKYDSTKIKYLTAANWATNLSAAGGYNRSATDNKTFVRIGITGGSVNQDGGGSPAGMDLTSSYTTWVQLQFSTLDSTQVTDLIIDTTSNAIGLFENHANDPNTGKIINDSLSTPANITNQPLPITLSAFTAVPAVSGGVKIAWTTLSEINCYGYYIQKSAQASTGYQDIAGSFTAGNGTTSTPHSYSFTDANPGAGTWYYRLKEVDQNGSIHYAEPVQVSGLTSVASSDLPTTFGLSQNYPNPFNPTTTIRYALPVRSHVVLTVYDALGQSVGELVNGDMSAGYHMVVFNGSRFASGLYFYRIQAGSFVATKSLVLVK